mgnify:CR=1 FL=1
MYFIQHDYDSRAAESWRQLWGSLISNLDYDDWHIGANFLQDLFQASGEVTAKDVLFVHLILANRRPFILELVARDIAEAGIVRQAIDEWCLRGPLKEVKK